MYKELTKEEIDQIEHNQNYGPENTMEKAQISSTDSVSYTHLTLPTKA